MKSMLLLLIAFCLQISPPAAFAANLCGPVFSKSKTLTERWMDRKLTAHEKSLEAALRAGDQSLELWLSEKITLLEMRESLLKHRKQMPPAFDQQRANLESIFTQKQELADLVKLRLQLEPASFSMKLKVALTRLRDSKIGAVLSLPYLPQIKNNSVSTETLSRWMTEGFEKNQKEIDSFLLKQGRIQSYHNVRFAWGQIVNVTLAYMLIGMLMDAPEEAQEAIELALTEAAEKEKLKITESLPDANALLQLQAEASLKVMVTRYIQNYGTAPSEAEYNYLKEIAYKEYGL